MSTIEWAGESTAALSVSDYDAALAWYRDYDPDGNALMLAQQLR
jgi:hypothetical protein